MKSFASLEGELTIDAHHDGRGTVYCEVCLRQPWPPEWAVCVVLDFGAGAHLEGLAGEVEQLLACTEVPLIAPVLTPAASGPPTAQANRSSIRGGPVGS